MCGIAGIFKTNKSQPDLDRLAGACRLLEHRGPDEEGFFVEKSVALGHRRLSIIDILTGHQPMSTADGRFHVVYNGEVYNFRGIRSKLEKEGARFKTESDTEVLLEAFVRYGRKCLDLFTGMFSFAVYDKKEETLFLARDRLGVKPLFYYRDSSGFYFASEIPALLMLVPVSRLVNPEAIDLFLSFRYINAPLTAIKGVNRFLPGHFMEVKDGKVCRYEKYWDVHANETVDVSYDEAVETFRNLFDEAVRLRMIADVPLGAFLSGGVDSSLVVASMAHMTDKVKTFSIGFKEQKFNELPYAKEIARKFHTEHLEVVVEPDVVRIVPEIVKKFGEPFGNETSILLYYMSQVAARDVKVVLSGDGGDEAFAGYKRYGQCLQVERLKALGLKNTYTALRRLCLRLESLVNPKRKNVKFPAKAGDVALIDKSGFPYLAFLSIFDRKDRELFYNKNGPLYPLIDQQLPRKAISKWLLPDQVPALTRLQYVDIKTYLPGDILYYVDTMSMANSLETRSPFLDHKIVEFALRLPPSYKLKGQKGKRILKDAFTDRIPKSFFERRKKGFSVPLAKWVSGPLNDHITETVLDAGRVFYALFDRRNVEKLLSTGPGLDSRLAQKIWNLYILANWLNLFDVEV